MYGQLLGGVFAGVLRDADDLDSFPFAAIFYFRHERYVQRHGLRITGLSQAGADFRLGQSFCKAVQLRLLPAGAITLDVVAGPREPACGGYLMRLVVCFIDIEVILVLFRDRRRMEYREDVVLLATASAVIFLLSGVWGRLGSALARDRLHVVERLFDCHSRSSDWGVLR